MKSRFKLQVLVIVFYSVTLAITSGCSSTKRTVIVLEDKQEWEMVKENPSEKTGWKLYTREIKNSDNWEFRIIGNVSSSSVVAQKAAMAMVIDEKYYVSKKGKKYGSFTILEQTERNLLLYSLMYVPFPFRNRDVIVKYEFYDNNKDNSVGMKWHHTTDDRYPEIKNIVRMPVDIGDWNFVPNGKNSCIAMCTLQFNPGKMPSGFIKSTVKKMLPGELENLREVVKINH